MLNPPNLTLHDFLTDDQIKQAMAIFRDCPDTPAKRICSEVMEPNMSEINKKIHAAGGPPENLPMYLAYSAEYAIRESQGKR